MANAELELVLKLTFIYDLCHLYVKLMVKEKSCFNFLLTELSSYRHTDEINLLTILETIISSPQACK